MVTSRLVKFTRISTKSSTPFRLQSRAEVVWVIVPSKVHGGLTTPPPGTEWRFVKDGGGYKVLLKLPDGKSDFAVNVWALPKPDPAFLKELK